MTEQRVLKEEMRASEMTMLEKTCVCNTIRSETEKQVCMLAIKSNQSILSSIKDPLSKIKVESGEESDV